MKDKIRYCLIVDPMSYFPQLLEDPERPGLYNWPKVFGGEVRRMEGIAPEEYEDFDVLHVNLTGSGQDIPETIRSLLPRSTSTKLVVNLDYPPDSPSFQAAFPFVGRFVKAIWLSDYAFATEPSSYNLLKYVADNAKELASPGFEVFIKRVALIPHPCPTHRIKEFLLPEEQRDNLLVIQYHRYDKHLNIPSMLTHNLTHKGTSIATMLTGFTEPQMPTGAFDYFHSYGDWRKHIQMVRRAKVALDYITCHSHSRAVEEYACLKIPTVCTTFSYSGRILFPDTCFEPWEFQRMRDCLRRLLDDEYYYNSVGSYAFDAVEHFGYDESKERFLELIE